MEETLSKEQVLLLNNLMYMTNTKPFESITSTNATSMKAYISTINTSNIDNNKEYGSLMNGDDWINIISAIRNDDDLMNMQIVTTHTDDDGGGVSALFVNPSTKEAVVTFRGTGSNEWKDNFVGGGTTDLVDGVSTPYQENALDWYQSLELEQYNTVTVTGHSKGGNKAKYITIMDNSVDRCLSYDGQGFSDEFVEKYYDKIAINQDKINNHNIEGDYVNLLLNDVGNTTYFKGYDLGKGGFLENHCPNTFFDFNNKNNYKMVVGERDEGMEIVDKYLNSFLRSLSKDKKKDSLEMIGELVELGFNDASADELLDILLEENNLERAAELIAYSLVYKKAHPELIDTITGILDNMKMDDAKKIVEVFDSITSNKYFKEILGITAWASAFIPDSIYKNLAEQLSKEYGIHLSINEIKRLVGLLGMIENKMDDVKLTDDGSDIEVPELNLPNSVKCKKSVFRVYSSKVWEESLYLDNYYLDLHRQIDEFHRVSKNVSIDMPGISYALIRIERELYSQATAFKKMKKSFEIIKKIYDRSEKKVITNRISCGYNMFKNS